MEFLGIGYQELLLVLVLLLVVVGPERLPGMAYQLGKTVRTMQKYARAVRDEFKDEFDYVEEQVRVVRGEITEARGAIQEQSKAFNAEMKAMNDGLQSDLKTDLPPLLPSAETPKPAASSSTAQSAPAKPAESSQGTSGNGKPPLVF